MAKPKLNMNAGFDLKASLMGSMEKLNNVAETAEPDLNEPRSFKRISYQRLYPSKLNDYPIEDIQEMESLLLKYGQLEPLNVNYDEDTDNYEIEGGERRFTALGNLFNRFENMAEPDNSPEYELYCQNVRCLYKTGIYCMVEHGPRDRQSVRARIIIHNESSRPFDPIRTASKLNELSQIYSEQNKALPKELQFNVNEKIASDLKGKYSVRTIIRYKNFDKLIDELKDAAINYNLSIADISKYHDLSVEEQLSVVEYIVSCHEQNIPLVLPSKEELIEAVKEAADDNENFASEDSYNFNDSFMANIEQESSDEFSSVAEENLAGEKNASIEDIKAKAAQRIIADKSKKENKIKDTVNALQKKSFQLEKVVLSFITESEDAAQADIDEIVSDIDMILTTLNEIKTTLKQ